MSCFLIQSVVGAVQQIDTRELLYSLEPNNGANGIESSIASVRFHCLIAIDLIKQRQLKHFAARQANRLCTLLVVVSNVCQLVNGGTSFSLANVRYTSVTSYTRLALKMKPIRSVVVLGEKCATIFTFTRTQQIGSISLALASLNQINILNTGSFIYLIKTWHCQSRS